MRLITAFTRIVSLFPAILTHFRSQDVSSVLPDTTEIVHFGCLKNIKK